MPQPTSSELKTSPRKRRTLYFALVLVLVAGLVLVFFAEPLLNSIGQKLVYQEDSMQPAPVLVVLAGGKGGRIEEAIKLYQRGLAQHLLFSGYSLYAGLSTNEVMKRHAIELGIPEDRVIGIASREEASTWGEALSNLKVLRQRGWSRFILLSSSFHTQRARWTYQRAIEETGGGLTFMVHAAPDPRVPIQGWWRQRYSRKMIVLEYIKFLNSYLEHG